MIRRLFSTLFFVVALAVAATGQETNAPIDYDEWQTTALRAEEAVENGRASDEAFLTLREEVNGWRQKFQTAQTTNQSRIQTIREQIAALGSVPEDNTVETPEIAQRRRDLNDQLARIEAPRRTAEEAFRRANGIIAEIDAIARERQASRLLSIGPSPLNPTLWGNALFELFDSIDSTFIGVATALSTESRIKDARNNLPLSLLLTIVALVLLLRARSWLEFLAARIEARETRASAGLTGFVVSLGQVLFPVAGVFALVKALSVTGLYGPRGAVILEVLPLAGIAIFVARWLAVRIFPRIKAVRSPLVLRAERRSEGRLYVTLLGFLLGFDLLLGALSDIDKYPTEAQVTLNFPILVAAGLLLFRIGQILRKHKTDSDEVTEAGRYRDRLIRALGRAAIFVGLAGPVLAAIGYGAAAEAIVWPAVLTLALFASLVLSARGDPRRLVALVPGRGL